MNAQNIAKQLMKHCADEENAEVRWSQYGTVHFVLWQHGIQYTASVYTNDEDRDMSGKLTAVGAVESLIDETIVEYDGDTYSTDAGAVRAAIALMAEMRRDYGGEA